MNLKQQREIRGVAINIGLIGTGMVAKALAEKIVETGHELTVGSRSADSESLAAFKEMPGVATGSFADAAAFGELLINATNGNHTLDALELAGLENLAGKTLIDVANYLDHTEMPPRATASPDHCLGVAVQERFPEAKVVKALNTMNCSVMVDPSLVQGDHVAFVSGEDESAKHQVKELLKQFGWRDAQLIDLGGIETAAAAEMMMAIWLKVMIARGGFAAGPFNFAINSG